MARFFRVLISVLLSLSIATWGVNARKEGKLSGGDDRVREGIREIYKNSLYAFPDCIAHDSQTACCLTAMESIKTETGLELCHLYEKFLFTRGLIFLCEKPTIVRSCPKLMPKQPDRTSEGARRRSLAMLVVD